MDLFQEKLIIKALKAQKNVEKYFAELAEALFKFYVIQSASTARRRSRQLQCALKHIRMRGIILHRRC